MQTTKEDNEIHIANEEIELEIVRSEIINEDSTNETSVNKENISNQIFEEKVLAKECEKRSITVDKEQQQTLRKVAFSNSISDKNMEKVNSMNMTEEEFRNYLYNKLMDMQLRVKLKKELLEEINTNNIKINNQEFKERVEAFNEYKNSKSFNLDEAIPKAEELLNEYITILENQYTKLLN